MGAFHHMPTLEFTGERFVNKENRLTTLAMEHLHRYAMASAYVNNKIVLDAACGCGFGSDILASQAKEVYAIDIAEEAIAYARATYQKNNLFFKTANIASLPFPDETFDVVVSFETIEHVDAQTQNVFLQEIKRVLKANGLLIISSPNKRFYTDTQVGENHFHIHEFYQEEFVSKLHEYFEYTDFGRQKVVTGSLIEASSNSCQFYSCKMREDGVAIIGNTVPHDFPYDIAIASSQPIMQTIPTSLSIDAENAIFQQIQSDFHAYESGELLNFELFYQDGEEEFTQSKSISLPVYKDKSTNFFKLQIELPAHSSQTKYRIDFGLKNQLLLIQCLEIRNERDEIIWKLDINNRASIVNMHILDNLPPLLIPSTDDPNIYICDEIWNTFYRKLVLKVEIPESVLYLIQRLQQELNVYRQELDACKQKLSVFENFLMCRTILDKVKENRFGALFIKALKFYMRNGLSATIQKILYGMPVLCNNCLLISQASLKKILKSSRMSAASKLSVKVAIIIPVYNGLQHLRKLTRTLFKNTNENQCRFVFINDASPDSSITPFLQELQRRDSRVVLMENPKNLGFVKTVNKAVNANRDVDVFVILNTDTEVPPGWLSRLIQPMLQDPKVATVTPFSNGATIFSVPIPDENNRDLINVFTTEEIDQAFQKYSLPESNTQTVCGVGFCMALNPKVWREIGPLDEKTFEKGFGEEADWCMRAFRAGYKNVISPNLFVSHFHGGSFSSNEKIQLLKCHQTILDQRYPEFQKLLQKHNSINAPLWTTIGIAAILETVLSETAAPLVILDHSWGGGANSFRNKMIQDTLAEGRSVLLLIPAGQSIHAIAYRNNFKVECRLANLSLLKHPLFRNIHEIVLNELVSWPDLYGGNKLSAKQYMKFVQNFIEIKNHLRATVRYMFHDFFLLCPHLNLFSNQGHYCKPSKSAAECISCIKTHMPYERYYRVESSLTGTAWRAASQELINNIDEIRFFSQNSLEIVKNLLDMKDSQVSLIPHAPQHQFVPIKLTTSPLTIGFVGAISKVKGADFVVEFANYLKQHAPEVGIVIIGSIDTDVANIPDNIHVHGAYQPEELPSLIDRYGINIGFISSLCPETFSYVTQELMMLGIPLVCFDIGAPADRIRNWNKGMIIPEITTAAAWATIQKLHNDQNSSK